jgi:hypothetical protein
MRIFGARGVNDQIPMPPDTVGSVIVTTALAVVAQDWPSSAGYVLFSGTMDFYANFGSTGANVPSTNSTGVTLSSGLNELNPGLRSVSTGLSTGYSITAPTSGVVTASFWRK